MDKPSTTAARLKAVKGATNSLGPVRRAYTDEEKRLALRTAFVARFIVLREGRRSRAHRIIEEMVWTSDATAEGVQAMFKQAFVANGDKLQPVERDLGRAMKHARRSADYFIDQYLDRSTTTFAEALIDYVRSNSLLFGDGEEQPRSSGWRISDR